MTMPRRTSLLSVLLVLAMVAAALTPWAAAAGPALVTSSQESTSQAVGFTGLPGGCQSLQATFTLSQSSPSYDFVLDGSLAALPGVHATHRQEGDRVTVYVTLRTGTLTDSGSLTLGTLSTAGTPFTVTGCTVDKLLGTDSGELSTGSGGQQSGGSGGQTNSGSGSSGGQASGGSGSDGEDLWSIQVDRPTGGTLTASRSQAASGRTVTLTAVPDQGYVLKEVTVVTAAGKSLSLTDKKNGTYTFVMPSAHVTVSAVFVSEAAPEGEGEEALPFTDVASGDWYAQAVAYVYRQGLMSGTAQDRFSPDLTTSRAMIVTILHRLAGSPAVTGGAAFTDVASGDWYAGGVAWASANGIVTGYGDGRFGPNDPITREQLAAILHRYAGFVGRSTAGRADLSGYTDAGQVSAYAADAMGWAVDRGLITGVSAHTLVPGGSATRAQAATILMRFCQMAQS